MGQCLTLPLQLAARDTALAHTSQTSAASSNKPTTECGIFWDYENVRVPRGLDVCDVWDRVRGAVHKAAGHLSAEPCIVAERRVYFDSRHPTESTTDRVTLDLSGFTLVDCPKRNKKETLDKKIIVDLMHFAWERRARHTPCCVVLISSDADFSYMLSRLRDLGTLVVVVHDTNTSDVLLASANINLHWTGDVLSGSLPAPRPAPLALTLDDAADAAAQPTRVVTPTGSDIDHFVTLLCAWIDGKGGSVTAAQMGEFYAAHPTVDKSILPATKKLEHLCSHADARGRLRFSPEAQVAGGGWLHLAGSTPPSREDRGARDDKSSPWPTTWPTGASVLAKYTPESRSWKRATVVSAADDEGSVIVRFDGYHDDIALPIERVMSAPTAAPPPVAAPPASVHLGDVRMDLRMPVARLGDLQEEADVARAAAIPAMTIPTPVAAAAVRRPSWVDLSACANIDNQRASEAAAAAGWAGDGVTTNLSTGYLQAFLICLRKQQQKQGESSAAQGNLGSYSMYWVLDANVASTYYQVKGFKDQERYKAIKESAKVSGFIEMVALGPGGAGPVKMRLTPAGVSAIIHLSNADADSGD